MDQEKLGSSAIISLLKNNVYFPPNILSKIEPVYIKWDNPHKNEEMEEILSETFSDTIRRFSIIGDLSDFLSELSESQRELVKEIDLPSYADDNVLSIILNIFPNLEYLNISNNVNITGDGFADLPKLNKLVTLTFNSCTNLINENFIAFLRKCPELKKLSCFYSSNITGNGFVDLPKLNKLEILQLFQCKNLTNNNFVSFLRKCPDITYLSCCENSHITGNGFADLPKLNKLKELHLSNLTNLSNDFFIDLLTHLTQKRLIF